MELAKNSREIIALLIKDGWLLKRITGSHHHFAKVGVPVIVTVPHPKRDLPIGTVRSIYKQAGWL
jgi:predicted RNA binding protein YcfA (HicA-like mRNA interferase family)